MATRHIKRFLQETAPQPVPDEPESESEEEEPQAEPFNPFSLLSDDDEEEEVAHASASDSDAAAGEDDASASAPQLQQVAAAASGSSSSKKKKNKQKKKQKPGGKQQQQPGSEAAPGAGSSAPAAAAAAAAADADDIDAILQELNITPAAAAAVSSSAPASSSTQPAGRRAAAAAAAAGVSPLLGVDPRLIRGDSELRRMFGAGVVAAVDRMEGGGGGGRRGPGGAAASSARAAVRRRQLKKCMLVVPAEHWPNVDSGISMRQAAPGPDGVRRWAYTWSPNYQAAQRVFEAAQASYDPNAVAGMLAQFPYHVDSLLAMNELYRSMGEAQTADDMLHRALYALEAAWAPGFDPTSGDVRLDFEAPPNRGLFLALFRHAQALSRRGCHVSALEVAKLLLALDPEDPLGALLLLDYLALRAGAAVFLERFVAEFDGSHSLALLPNYAFSLPLARYRLEQQQQQAAATGSAASGTGSRAAVSSLTLLAQALLLHPLVLRELVEKLQGQGSARESAWQQLLGRKLYAKASDHGSSSLGHLVSLFVERSYQLWKAPDVQAWLRIAAEAAADVADGKPRRTAAAQAAQPGVLPSSPDAVVIEGSAADWACVAAESFPPSSRNEYGHLRLADFADTVNQLPQEEMQAAAAAAAQGGGGAGGDLAALEALQEMLLAQEQLAPAAAGGAAGGAPGAMPDEALRAANPLLMLLQSMLPWVNAGQQPDYDADGRGEQPPPPQQ